MVTLELVREEMKKRLELDSQLHSDICFPPCSK